MYILSATKSLLMIPVSDQFVISLEVVDFGMFCMEHFKRTLWLVHF